MKLKWVITLAVCMLAFPAWADTVIVPIISQGIIADVNETNTVAIGTVSGWTVPTTPATWVTDPTTAGGTEKPNNTTSTFTQKFFLPYATNTGSVTVWADDTADVLLDGNMIWAANNGVPNGPCQLGIVGCIPQYGGAVSLNGLGAGPHILTVTAYQVAGDGFGALWQGNVSSTVPDGGVTLMLLGGALVGLETLRRKFRV